MSWSFPLWAARFLDRKYKQASPALQQQVDYKDSDGRQHIYIFNLQPLWQEFTNPEGNISFEASSSEETPWPKPWCLVCAKAVLQYLMCQELRTNH